MSIVFATTHPQRTSALILYGAFPRRAWAHYVWGRTDEQLAARLNSIEEKWGRGNLIDFMAPSLAGDQELRRFVGRLERSSASPGAAQTLVRMDQAIDVRQVLRTIDVPTLAGISTDPY
jgi:pimeloyl-ACP methyl ester carboxylesterase